MWIIAPSTCCRSAQEAGGSILPSDSQFQTLERSAMWRSKPSLARYWRKRWKAVSWMRLLSGLTYEPSTLEDGAESWIASLRATRANLSPWRAKDLATKTLGTFGPKCGESLRSVHPRFASLRTSQGTLDLDSNKSEQTYSEWVTELKAYSSGLRMLVRPTEGNESSSWPTAQAFDATGIERSKESLARAKMSGGCANLREVVQVWATPQASDDNIDRGSDEFQKRWKARPNSGKQLAIEARMFQSSRQPQTMNRGRGSSNDGPNSLPLYPTPRGQDSYERRNFKTKQKIHAEGWDMTLPTFVETEQQMRLNPTFVEWLMGWHLGLTAFDCSETGSYQYKRLWRSYLCSLLWKVE